MKFLDDLIFGVLSYVNDAEIKTYDDIAISMRASEIILDERDFNFSYKGSKKMNFVKSEKLVREFLGGLNSAYLDYYDMRLLDGTFEYGINDFFGNPYSTYDYENSKRIIYIPISNTIEDGFSIVHELFHDMNMVIDTDEPGIGWYFFTEALSFLGELLYSDFLKEKGILDENVKNRSLYFMRHQALVMNFKLNIINEYLKYGFLDRSMVLDVLKLYKYEDIIDSIYDEDFRIEVEETYVFSCLVAVYMYDRIKNNKKNINELFDLNEIVGSLDLFQVLDYLDLEHNNRELTEDSYELLRKKYRKFLKR